MENVLWPFIIIRNYGTGAENPDFLRSLFAAQKKYPGLINEIWFAGNVFETWEVNQKIAHENTVYRDECKALGIDFSYQQGWTLNHSSDGKKRENLFTADAWAVDSNGERAYGVFCPNSPEVRAYSQATAEKFLAELQPAAYWPDDDLRLYCKGGRNYCFCDNCLAAFNKKHGYDFTRESLVEILFSSAGECKTVSRGQVRREWSIFNGESLAGFAAVFRAAVDKVKPDCRLGIQTVTSQWQYDGLDYRPIIEALAGKERKAVGVRPGSGYYNERVPRYMTMKVLATGEEAARCRKYGCVGQICYEAENWPHISAQKSPEAMMIECSLVMASGMDSLALYWGADSNAESEENYEFFFDTLALYKPYFAAIRDAFKDSSLVGGVLYHGSNTFEQESWCAKAEEDEMHLISNGLPVVRENSISEFMILNKRAVLELGDDDLKKVFSSAVLIDIDAYKLLAERFPGLEFLRKVKLHDTDCRVKDEGGEIFYECFEDKRYAGNFRTIITPCASDVKTFSSFTNGVEGSGICSIPTEFGGTVVLIQFININMLNGYRRKAICDALDSAIPGGMAARLMTNGLAMQIIARRSDISGKTVGVYLQNQSIGSTPELEVALRDPEFAEYQLVTPKQAPIKLTVLARKNNEIRLQIPPLAGWQGALIAGCKIK